ncbi:MAG: MFS transporter [Pseudomonadota bacterium]
MAHTLVRVSTLLFAVAILLTGHGLQLTLLPMRAEALGWSSGAIGATGSAYFAGFVVGCLVIPSIVAQVAHIRTFMVMAAIATIALLGAGMFDHVPAWLVLRFATGFAFAGLYMVMESWLSEASAPERRGRVLGIYSMISLVAMMVGQTFVGLSEPGELKLFMGAACILGLAIIPIGLTRMAAPAPIPRTRFSPRVLLEVSRVAVVSSFFAGLVTGAFWAVGPLVGRGVGLDGAGVGLMMAAAIAGGALVQFPAGRLSDRTDRRFVLAGMFVLGTVLASLGWLFSEASPGMLYLAMLFIGGMSLPVYPLCIATAGDNSEIPLIQIASGILIVNSIGSVLGPMLVSLPMAALGVSGFFPFVAVTMALGAVWAFYRISVVERPRVHEQRFMGVPKTSVVAAELAETAREAELDRSEPSPERVGYARPQDST